jgi:hypothetical protein
VGNSLGIEKKKVQVKKFFSVYNLAWILLFISQFIYIGNKYGYNVYCFGRSFGYCLIPFVFGVGWMIKKGDSKALKITYLVLTILFFLMAIFNYIQKTPI